MRGSVVAALLVFVFVLAPLASAHAQRPTPPTTAPPRASASASAPAPPPAAPPAPSSSAAPSPDDARKADARQHFEAGLAHFDRSEWSAALAEFLRSRQIFPTRAATKNAAICLRKEGRFDEALEMYDALLRDFPDLSPADKQFAEKEIEELRGSIGTIEIRGAEPGADVVIDGRSRGTFPATAPLRVSAGSHVVRVYKEGFLPFETRVDVAGRQNAVVTAQLGALTQSGRLRVSEQQGRVLDVVVDNVAVGKTPWEGSIAIGDHVVVLRGEGNLGTQPASAPVKLNQLTPLTLIAEELEAQARVDPTPVGASVAIDGVVVGRGVWEGKLRAGGHSVEVGAEGFLPYKRDLALAKGQREVVVVKLERDPTSPLWAAQHPSRFVLELVASGAFSASFGGDLADACTGSCSYGLPLGGKGVLHAAYELGTGLGFSVDGGYLFQAAALADRPATLTAPLRPANNGTVTDKLRLSGLTLGASAYYHRGETWPLTLRLGIGALLGSAKDTRSGSFTNSLGAPYTTSSAETPSATFLYAAPEVRIARRIGEHFELSLGVEVMVLTALSQPKWKDQVLPLTGPPGTQGDGLGSFGSQSLTGSLVFVVAPGLGARYEF